MDLLIILLIVFTISNIYALSRIISEEKDKNFEYCLIMIPFSIVFLALGPISTISYFLTELMSINSKGRI